MRPSHLFPLLSTLYRSCSLSLSFGSILFQPVDQSRRLLNVLCHCSLIPVVQLGRLSDSLACQRIYCVVMHRMPRSFLVGILFHAEHGALSASSMQKFYDTQRPTFHYILFKHIIMYSNATTEAIALTELLF